VTSGAGGGRRALAGAAVTGVAVAALAVSACGGPGGFPVSAGTGKAAPSGVASAGSSPASARSSRVGTSDSAASAAPAPSGMAPSGMPPSGMAARGTQSRQADPFSAAVEGYLDGRAGTTLAAVYDVRTGQSWRLGDGPAQDEASVVKLDILEALLNASDGAGLSDDEQALAQQMIENSDNDAATALWDAAGGAAGLAAYNAQAGLTGTTPSPCVVCAGFPWPGWGLTTTVPDDQITLLKRIIGPSSLLTSAERSYALSLLENVAPGQAWGISGGIPAGVTVALKNGWLPLNDADTDWQINSEGWVSGDGRDYLISVLTTGNPDEQYGIDTASGLSSLIWTAMG
jgi:Beta-lactamase enzyme family